MADSSPRLSPQPDNPEEHGPASPPGSPPGSPPESGPASPDKSDPDSPLASGPSSPQESNENIIEDKDPASPEKEGAEDNSEQTKSTAQKRKIESDSENEEDQEDRPSSAKKRIEYSDDEESEGETSAAKKRIDSSGDEANTASADKNGSDDVEGEGSGKKRKRIGSTDDEDEPAAKAKGSDAEASDKEEEGEELIADIFGDSSDEEGEFQGFDEAEIKKTSEAAAEQVLPELSSGDELDDDSNKKADFVSDFDMIMQQKKEERAKGRRKKRNVDIINDNDDLIVDLLRRMREAAEEDRTLNQNRQPAIRKLTMLQTVITQLNKSELQAAFMDSGLLTSLTEWLAPLPDKSLPHLAIREALLKLLCTLPHPHTDQLKSSGIGKAIMYLFKHPKELRANRDMAGRLINEWSRPIFGQSSNFKNISREDRERRDLQSVPKNRRKSSDSGAKNEEEQKALRPGDPGWIYRARVPQPSNRDYVNRPESSVGVDEYTKGSSKKPVNRFEKQKRKLDTKKKMLKSQQAVKISIEGRNM